ncbi:MAG: hypothetical protein AB8H03_21375 [Saprospiraceae bacterium]
MKQQLSAFVFPFNFKSTRRFFLWFLLSLTLVVMLSLPSFSNLELSTSSSILPFSKTIALESTAINCKINNAIAKGFFSKEASLFKMEQAEGVFAKMLNMSLEDGDGNLFALSLVDLENEEMDSCLTSNVYFGNEHENSDQNFSNDIGSTIFANYSSLIFEKTDGSSFISRDGWIKINRCENGRISGSFNFKMDEDKSTKVMEGEFVNVLLRKE